MRFRFLPAFFLLPLVFSCEPDNQAPLALIRCIPEEGNIRTLFDLDAGQSSDPDGLDHLLEYRWDTDGNGTWETGFGAQKLIAVRYPAPGTYEIRLEVKDSYGAVSQAVLPVFVDSLHYLTDSRDGQVYPIMKSGANWWMGRNLDYGTAIPLEQDMKNDQIVEKYAHPAGEADSLAGGLYTWVEMMAYTYQEGGRGICPPGWHVPSDGDWKALMARFTDVAIHQYPGYQISGEKFIPDRYVAHDNYQASGAIWMLLRETGNTGFDAVLAGYRDPEGNYGDRDYHFPGHTATFWTSTISSDYAIRVRFYVTEDHQGEVFRLADNRRFAFSVRCVKPVD